MEDIQQASIYVSTELNARITELLVSYYYGTHKQAKYAFFIDALLGQVIDYGK